MRAVGLHADVIVATSRAFQTTCTLVRSDGEAFCIDSPVFPDELEILPAMAEQAGFGVVGLLATHADWDHLLGRYAFPEAPLGCSETSAARLVNEPGAAQRELRTFDEELYVERPRPLSLPSAQRLDVPGGVEIGDRELVLEAADGHTDDGMAVWIPWARVLVAGDYLSPVEIPMIEGSARAYLATLARLEPLVEQADYVVPGHGAAARRRAGGGDPARGPRVRRGAARARRGGEAPARPPHGGAAEDPRAQRGATSA